MSQDTETLDLASFNGKSPTLFPKPDIHGATVNDRIFKFMPHSTPAGCSCSSTRMVVSKQGRIQVAYGAPAGTDWLISFIAVYCLLCVQGFPIIIAHNHHALHG